MNSDQAFNMTGRRAHIALSPSFWSSPGTSPASGTPVEWLADLDRPVVEIFCFCDAETAANRFKSRNRHPGHLDASRSFQQLLDQLHRLAEAGPLRIGELIVVDTRTEPNIEDIVERICAKVEEINAV